MFHDDELIKDLEAKARRIRLNCLRQFSAQAQGHCGGTMSVVEIVTALYMHHIRFDPNDPDWAERDRVVMSKAHCCEAIYAALVELGVYPEETLDTYYAFGSPFQGHADRWCTKGIEYSGGSLGQGLSFAAGLAYAEKLTQRLNPRIPAEPRHIVRYGPRFRTYCILGDGELQEGGVWEAAMFAAASQLDNLIAIVDYNKWEFAGPTSEIMPIEPLVEKWRAFGWWVHELDGHDLRQIAEALDLADRLYGDNRPKILIAHTTKGNGISIWEDLHLHLGRGDLIVRGVAEGNVTYADAR